MLFDGVRLSSLESTRVKTSVCNGGDPRMFLTRIEGSRPNLRPRHRVPRPEVVVPSTLLHQLLHLFKRADGLYSFCDLREVTLEFHQLSLKGIGRGCKLCRLRAVGQGLPSHRR